MRASRARSAALCPLPIRGRPNPDALGGLRDLRVHQRRRDEGVAPVGMVRRSCPGVQPLAVGRGGIRAKHEDDPDCRHQHYLQPPYLYGWRQGHETDRATLRIWPGSRWVRPRQRHGIRIDELTCPLRRAAGNWARLQAHSTSSGSRAGGCSLCPRRQRRGRHGAAASSGRGNRVCLSLIPAPTACRRASSRQGELPFDASPGVICDSSKGRTAALSPSPERRRRLQLCLA